MPHPPAPWHLNGELVVVPALTSARQLGGVMLANYTSGTLVYRELIVFSHATARGMVVSHIYVDSEQSMSGGHEIWQLPKELAEFEYGDRTFTARQGDDDAPAREAAPPPRRAADRHPDPDHEPGGPDDRPRAHQGGAGAGRAADPAQQPVRVPGPGRHATSRWRATTCACTCLRRRSPNSPSIAPWRCDTLSVRHFLRPLFDRVVVKELEPDRIRQSGLLVPAGTHEPPPQHGIVLAVGPGLDWWESAGITMPVKPGDHVVFPASAGRGWRSTRSGCWSVASVSCWACSTRSRTRSPRDRGPRARHPPLGAAPPGVASGRVRREGRRLPRPRGLRAPS